MARANQTLLEEELLYVDFGDGNRTFNGSDFYEIYEYDYYFGIPEHERQKLLLVSNAIGYVLAALISLLNGLVIVLLCRHGRENSRVQFFILQLAIADFLVGAVSLLSDTIHHTVGRWLAGDVACRLSYFVGNAILCASNNLLIGMSVDRFLAVAAPMRSVRAGTYMCKVFVAGSWLLGVLVNVFFLVYSGAEAERCQLRLPNTWWQPYLTVVFLAIYVLPAMTIVVCYTSICVIIWKKWRKTKNMSTQRFNTIKEIALEMGFLDIRQRRFCSSEIVLRRDGVTVQTHVPRDSRIQGGVLPKAKVKSIKMTVAICLAFLICWSPYFYYNMLMTYGVIPISVKNNMIINMLYPLNSIANPLIFICFNMRLVTAMSSRRRNNTSGTVTTTTLLNNAAL